ncbi:Uncharacterised protein [Bartonella grahamii]|uniref:Uncharacterized protein n=1 Tax=Bartonella grahamii TaxID=33045 RepID=A0A336N9Q2_BARGR|nr:Uncharacterised protein [Bartonella grahamii]
MPCVGDDTGVMEQAPPRCPAHDDRLPSLSLVNGTIKSPNKLEKNQKISKARGFFIIFDNFFNRPRGRSPNNPA